MSPQDLRRPAENSGGIRAGTHYSEHRVAEKAAEVAAKGALLRAGVSRAPIALFFATAAYRRRYAEIVKKIKEITGARNVVGASAFGIITEEMELERRPGVAVMVIQSEEIQSASFLIPDLQESNFKAGEKAAQLLASAGFNPSLLLLFPDTFSFQSHAFFDGFESRSGYLPMFGGTAAENGREQKTYQMEGGRAAFDALAGLALGGNLRVETGITRSCQPFGEPLRITRAEGNMIYEMDGRPAYDILLESISRIDFENPDEILERVFLGLPLRSFQTDFTDSHYLIRNIMGVNVKKGMLACVAPVEEGEFVTFAMRDPVFAKADLESMLEDLRMRLDPADPAFGIYFNCCSRGKSLYGRPNEDIDLIRRYFPRLPILGFFTYGEIAPVDHVNHIHHYSGVLSLFTENK